MDENGLWRWDNLNSILPKEIVEKIVSKFLASGVCNKRLNRKAKKIATH